MNWVTEEPSAINTETETQRKVRAQVFKLKKWIMNIENQPSKTPAMQSKIDAYTKELNILQGGRGFNKTPVFRSDIAVREEHRGYK